ncbi:MAG: ABC transporter permease [Fidelibacterota bacterium]
MYKILKYSFLDLIRSHWSTVYFLFYLVIGFLLLFINNDLSKAIITLLNIIIVLTPLTGTLLGVMYYYHSREFTELLLAQPLQRRTIFLGQYLGLSISLTSSVCLGLGIPFLAYGLVYSSEIFNFLSLLVVGALLSFIFTALALNIAIKNDDRIKGFGFAILVWLFLAVIYDGLFLVSLVSLADYPLEKLALGATVFNPIDLSRIYIVLKLDIAALLGYTGAVMNSFFGSFYGKFISFGLLLLWVVLPTLHLIRSARRKDF